MGKSTETNRLSVKAIDKIQRLKDYGRHGDGAGLYFLYEEHRSFWMLRLTVNGKRRDFGLGSLSTVSLLQARTVAQEYRVKARQGVDPLAGRNAVRALARKKQATFAWCAERAHVVKVKSLKNVKHQNQWLQTLNDYAFPVIGTKPVDQISTADVLKILTPLWHTKRETAQRVKQRMGVVLTWARVAGYRSGLSPVDEIGDAFA